MKNIIVLLALSFLVQRAAAQETKFTVSYPMGIPTGSDFKNYIGHPSFRGVSLEFNQQVHPGVDIGLETGWNVFYQRQDSKAYTEGTATISGVQYRHTDVIPILAGAKYYFHGGTNGNSEVTPYIGAGLGTLYVNRSTDMGLYRLTRSTWQFCLRPEAGFLFHIEHGLSLLAGVKYYAASGNDDLSGQSYLSVNIGLVFHTK